LPNEQQHLLQLPNVKLFAESKDLSPEEVRCVMSVGGDGTFLAAASLMFGTTIPVVGVSTGRLGFLPTISVDVNNVCGSLDNILLGNFDVEYRSMLQVEGCLGKQNHALNEVWFQKRGASIAEINVYINGEFLNNYWADGLIVATPTGSTAYSLSAGGPIVAPDAPCLIVSPIAPHSLNVRPIVVPDSAHIELEMLTRSGGVIIGIDSQSYEMPTGAKLKVQKSATKIGFIKFKHSSFYRTLREKLLWGVDRRG
jgi:NAD+ kinase